MNGYRSVGDLARLIKVPRYTIVGLILNRKLRCYWRDGQVMIHDSDFFAYLHRNNTGPPSTLQNIYAWLDERGW